MLSSAIYILGDITRLDLDESSSVSSKGLSEAQSLSGGEQQAEVGFEQQRPKGPVLMIKFSTRNKYLRRYAAYNYSNGFWNKPTDIESINYHGQLIPLNPSWPRTYAQVQFQVNPLANLTGHILTAQNTDNIRFNGTIQYYEDIQSFEATEPYDDPYWVSYKLFE